MAVGDPAVARAPAVADQDCRASVFVDVGEKDFPEGGSSFRGIEPGCAMAHLRISRFPDAQLRI
jgi:hypothetical protein